VTHQQRQLRSGLACRYSSNYHRYIGKAIADDQLWRVCASVSCLQVKCHACVGGTSVREDARILSAGVHVVVGTPGRVYDMLRRRCLRAGMYVCLGKVAGIVGCRG
jgi:hypothetical protein